MSGRRPGRCALARYRRPSGVRGACRTRAAGRCALSGTRHRCGSCLHPTAGRRVPRIVPEANLRTAPHRPPGRSMCSRRCRCASLGAIFLPAGWLRAHGTLPDEFATARTRPRADNLLRRDDGMDATEGGALESTQDRPSLTHPLGSRKRRRTFPGGTLIAMSSCLPDPNCIFFSPGSQLATHPGCVRLPRKPANEPVPDGTLCPSDGCGRGARLVPHTQTFTPSFESAVKLWRGRSSPASSPHADP